jgi:ankyrin repeat protein
MKTSLHSITKHKAAIKQMRDKRGIIKRGANKFEENGEEYSISFSATSNRQDIWKDYSDLMRASKMGETDKVVKILEHMSPDEAAKAINSIGGWNQTNALMLAAGSGSFEVVQLLIDKAGSALNLNVQNKMGNTALIIAAEMGHLNIVQLLIEHGASAYKQNVNRQIALMLAIDGGHLDIVRYLTTVQTTETDKPEDVTSNQLLIENKWCKTALIIAAEFGKNDIVEWLVDDM